MENVVLIPISLADLKIEFAQIVEEKIKNLLAENNRQEENNRESLATREEVAKRLRISLPTLNKITKEGAVQAYRIPGSRRVGYKWEEVEAVLQEINSTKYKRKDLK
ncbi:DNA-binding protein [Chryseobacterium indologenes]|uniref:helix-turn-helix transcriptional regulator n=1 Tax=Chryseobacterium indologenes TaxID=253 RepID=UPI00076E2FE9|nr:hypothetical protein [Chryseobacterium indologenes]TLX24045.1 DNA-binding protein [Chryseobacterium indologenes]